MHVPLLTGSIIGTGLLATTLFDWEGNCRPGRK